jgi:hypothetical protein
MLRNATATAATVLAAERLARHARNTKVFLVKLPEFEELLDHLPLLVPAADLGHIARILNHGVDVEIGRKTIENGKQNVQNRG